VTAFGFESTYRTLVMHESFTTFPAGWTDAAFDDSSWALHQAPFGNDDQRADCGFAPAKGPFPERGHVLLRKTFTLPAGAHGLRLRGTIDNYVVFTVNGHEMGYIANGDCLKDGIDVLVPDAYLNPGGENVLATVVDDWGIVSFFDMMATYEAAPAPTVTPTVTGTLGGGGWYTSDVNVSWDVSDASATTSGCEATTVVTDTNGLTFTCTATNAGGSTSESVTVKRDTTGPVLTASVSPAAVAQGASAAATAGATDGASGIASSSCEAVPAATLGPQTVSCAATDAAGNTSSGSASYLVYAASTGGGSFVVGDGSATGAVTFWGSQWAKANTLSGGAAPSAFKGFAASGATCGGTWTTGPGNSANPPAGPLPSYVAVIVASKASKSGSAISGTVKSIVVIKTNAGYAANPGHAGTGTVVATIC
jgi:hypothetical protein